MSNTDRTATSPRVSRRPGRARPPAGTPESEFDPRPTTRHRRVLLAVAAVIAGTILALYLVFQGSQVSKVQTRAPGTGSGYHHVAGQPGAGAAAPEFTLASSDGASVSLSHYRGKTVLLYFQEGLSCQPCWDQIKDLEQNQQALKSAGIDAVLSVTTDPAPLLAQKTTDERISTPVLSDPDLTVSRAYDANAYGMMGDMRDGHSFLLVDPEGTIRWRADYGGEPDYVMFVPTAKMLSDLARERT
ncbi:hypothetical protein GCM10009740_16360 [Terrabacter terrae]|uniref:Thioredoxin domain-containing protein n=1 Tax=Terrabacter terrae TaxID=318434 RepID=A0ABN2U1L6_9MICO